VGTRLENLNDLREMNEYGRLLLHHLLAFNRGASYIPAVYSTKHRISRTQQISELQQQQQSTSSSSSSSAAVDSNKALDGKTK
jgi:hypothetical protein